VETEYCQVMLDFSLSFIISSFSFLADMILHSFFFSWCIPRLLCACWTLPPLMRQGALLY